MCPSCCFKYMWPIQGLSNSLKGHANEEIVGGVFKIVLMVFMFMPFTHNDSVLVHKYDQLTHWYFDRMFTSDIPKRMGRIEDYS